MNWNGSGSKPLKEYYIPLLFIGSIFAAAMLKDSKHVAFSVALIEKISLISLAIYVFSKSKLYQNVIDNKATAMDKIVLAAFCAILSIYGTVFSIPFGGYFINIRDLGAMLGGLLGGPVVGLAAGLASAIHRLSVGGPFQWPCALATAAAGLGAGVLVMVRPKLRLSFLAVIVLAACAESFHMALLWVFLTPATAWDAFSHVAIPMYLANILGVIFFVVITKVQEAAKAKERIESELNIAHDIQMSIIPNTFPPFPHRKEFDLFASIKPAKAVGGDLYDFFFIDDNHLCFAIGDVSGKGVPASLFMAVTRTLMRAKAFNRAAPGEIATEMNRDLCENNDAAMFVTFFLAVVDLRDGKLEYCNAGHNPPYLVRKDGTLEKLGELHGIPLGVMDIKDYGSCVVPIAPGDAVVLYTDGVTEAETVTHELFGDERLQKLLQANAKSGSKAWVEIINREVTAFAGEAEQADDITVLAINFHSLSSPGQASAA